mgnify:CR=1 FL=1
MPKVIGRNRNTADSAQHSVVTVSSTTAVKIADANENRIFFEVSAPPVGVLNNHDYCVFIRLYAAADNNDEKGIWLGSYQVGNDSLFRGNWCMPSGDIYTGEISAILCPGNSDINVYVTEY